MTQVRMQETTTLRGAQLRQAITNEMETVFTRYRTTQGLNFSGSWTSDTRYSFQGGPSNSIHGVVDIQDMRTHSVVTVTAEVPNFAGAPAQFRQEVSNSLAHLPGHGQYPVSTPTTTQTAVAPGAQTPAPTTTTQSWSSSASPGAVTMTPAQQEAARIQEEMARAARQQVAGDIFGQIGLGLQQIFGQGAQEIAYEEAQSAGYPAAAPGQPVTTGYAEGKPGAAMPGAVSTGDQGFFQSVIDWVKPAPPEGYVAPGGTTAAPSSIDTGANYAAPPPPAEPAGMPGWFWGALVAAGLATAIGVTYMLVKQDDEEEEEF